MFVSNVSPNFSYNARTDINKLMSELLLDFSNTKEAKKVNVVFVDTSDHGELLKETFDISQTPSIRLVQGD